jgi:hypothetical protein
MYKVFLPKALLVPTSRYSVLAQTGPITQAAIKDVEEGNLNPILTIGGLR